MPPALLALRTDVHVWRCPALARLDAAMAALGFELLDLPWPSFGLLAHDRDHFTWRGLCGFCDALAAALAAALRRRGGPRAGAPRLCVCADSTVDYWNYDGDGRRHGRADARLAAALRREGIDARIAATCGAGFVARAGEGLHFRAAARRVAAADADALLVIGGWNDLARPERAVHGAAAALARPARAAAAAAR